jgi:hypothetical protein
MDIQQRRWECVDSIDVAKDREKTAGSCECGNELSVSVKCG